MGRNKHPPNLTHFVLMGYYHTPKAMQKTMICQTILFFIMFVFYYFWNGGIIPWFLKDHVLSSTHMKGSVKLVDHFTVTNRDGSIVKWGHATNDRESLLAAIQDPSIMMLEGDIQLKGQDSDNQQLLAVMVHPVSNDFSAKTNKDDGEFTFEDWLHVALASEKGIKLDFKSIEPVEIALQHLSSKKDKIKRPVHISADILQGPNGEHSRNKPVDTARFLRLATTYFADSTLVVGWTAESTHNKLQNRYTWDMVKEMYDTLHSRHIEQPISISVRAVFVKSSLSQLKWLCESLNLQMTIYSLENENVNTNDLLFIRQKFPIDTVYYDLHNKLSTTFDETKDNAANIAKEMMLTNSVFQTEEWRVINTEESLVYMGTESLIMGKGILLYKNDPYVFTNEPLKIRGRLEFFHYVYEETSIGESFVEIFFHVSNNIKSLEFSGMRLFIGLNGTIHLGPYGYKELTDIKSDFTFIKGETGCFYFEIAEMVGHSINVEVWRPLNCDNTQANRKLSTLGKVKIYLAGINPGHKHIAIKSTNSHCLLAIDNFVIYS